MRSVYHFKKIVANNNLIQPSFMAKQNDQLKMLGFNIRKWRELRDIKQIDLAARLTKDKSWISMVENGKVDIQFTHLLQIAEALSLKPNVLFTNFFDIVQIPAE